MRVPWAAPDVYAAMFKRRGERDLRVVKSGGDVTAAGRPIKRAVAQIPGAVCCSSLRRTLVFIRTHLAFNYLVLFLNCP